MASPFLTPAASRLPVLAPHRTGPRAKPDARQISAHVFAVLMSGALFAALVLLDFFTAMAPSSATAWGCVPLGLAMLAAYYSVIDHRPFAAVALTTLFALSLLACFGLDAGYAVHRAGRHFALMDDTLSRIDGALGFDWLAIFHFFVARPLLTQILRVPYDLAPQQMLLLAYVLMACGRHTRVLQLLCANFLALFLTHVIALFLPALGTYAHAGLSLADHPGVALTTRAGHVPSLLAARMAAAPDLDAFQRFGIVTFPSYHAVMVALMVWGFWDLAGWRVAALAWNAIVLIATPVHGSHYLCDIIAGVAVALSGIMLAAMASATIERWLREGQVSSLGAEKPSSPRSGSDR